MLRRGWAWLLAATLGYSLLFAGAVAGASEGASVRKSGTLTVNASGGAGVSAAVTWDTEVADSGSYWDAGNSTRFVPPEAGFCVVSAWGYFSTSSTSGYMGLSIRDDAGTVFGRVRSIRYTTVSYGRVAVSAVVYFDGTGYFEVYAEHNNNSNQAVTELAGGIMCGGAGGGGSTGPPGPTGPAGPAGATGAGCPTPAASGGADCAVEVTSFTGGALDWVSLVIFVLAVGLGFIGFAVTAVVVGLLVRRG